MDYAELLFANQIRKDAVASLAQQYPDGIPDGQVAPLMEREIRLILGGVLRAVQIIKAETGD